MDRDQKPVLTQTVQADLNQNLLSLSGENGQSGSYVKQKFENVIGSCRGQIDLQVHMTSQTVWNLLNILKKEKSNKFGLVILNRPIQPELHLIKTLWNEATFRASVDGGTNEIYDNLDHDTHIPDLITGDFDSVRPEVLQFYRNKTVEVVRTDDQDFTDFTKCLKVIAEKQWKVDFIAVCCCMGGRLDQIFANVETLFHACDILPGAQVYLLSNHSMACLLQKGKHVLHVKSGYEGEWCALIPVGCGCESVTTTGLKWNLDKGKLKFGELVSTSNTWGGSETVTVETDQPLLWTMGVNL